MEMVRSSNAQKDHRLKFLAGGLARANTPNQAEFGLCA